MGVRSCNPRTILQLRTLIDPPAKRLSANGFPRKRGKELRENRLGVGFGDFAVSVAVGVPTDREGNAV